MTRSVMISWYLALFFAVLAPLAMAYFGLSIKWGAHPFWDVKTAYIGAGIGVLLSLVLAWLKKGMRFFLGLSVLCTAIAAAYYGKMQFAASYAEDALAGKLWFFGWIGIATGIALIVSEIRDGLRRIL